MFEETIQQYHEWLHTLDWKRLQEEVHFFISYESQIGFGNNGIIDGLIIELNEQIRDVCVDLIGTFDDEEFWIRKDDNYYPTEWKTQVNR